MSDGTSPVKVLDGKSLRAINRVAKPRSSVRFALVAAVIALATGVSPMPAQAASDGSLDFTFDIDGKLTTAIGSSFDRASAIAIQTDGKIVAVGQSYNGTYDDFALARYNTDGSLDTSFGTGGKVTTDIGLYTDRAYSIAIQSDGKIVVGGGSWASNNIHPNNSDVALARYNTDGSLDTSFGAGGKVTQEIGTRLNAAYSIAMDAAGKIVVGSPYFDLGEGWYDFGLLRFNTNGTLDPTFDTDGWVTTKIGSGDETPRSIKIQTDGKIVAGGVSFNGTNNDFALVRYNADGSLDTTLDTDGKVTTAIGSGNDDARSIAIQSDGKIVAGGLAFGGTNNDFGVVRYESDGSPDTTFGTGGRVTTDFGFGNDDARSIAIQSDGKIVAGGLAFGGTNNDFGVVRYESDGSPDNTFDTDGKVTTAIGSSAAGATSIAIQSDDKIVAGGYSGDITNEDFALARYAPIHVLSVTRDGTGAGTVTSASVGINCGAACSDTFNNGALVTLTATPDPGSLFSGWTGDCAGTGTCALSMTSARTATATFDLEPPPPPPATITPTPTATPTPTPTPAEATSTVTLEYRTDIGFRGIVSSDSPDCVAGRSVEIYKVTDAGQELIGVAVTTSTGGYTFKRPKADRRFLAVVVQSSSTSVEGTGCGPGSDTVTVDRVETRLPGPGVKLYASDESPNFGDTIELRTLIKKCQGLEGDRIQLWRLEPNLTENDTIGNKRLRSMHDGIYRKLRVKLVDRECRAEFLITVAFEEATFRTIWPKQDPRYRVGRAEPVTIRS